MPSGGERSIAKLAPHQVTVAVAPSRRAGRPESKDSQQGGLFSRKRRELMESEGGALSGDAGFRAEGCFRARSSLNIIINSVKGLGFRVQGSVKS